ncbi:hypothetical protein Ancab_023228 [Ancistrocladus abbreviatus]
MGVFPCDTLLLKQVVCGYNDTCLLIKRSSDLGSPILPTRLLALEVVAEVLVEVLSHLRLQCSVLVWTEWWSWYCNVCYERNSASRFRKCLLASMYDLLIRGTRDR